jgi:hypothetical protein
MNAIEALDQIATHIHSFNLGVLVTRAGDIAGIEDEKALGAAIAATLLDFDGRQELWRGDTLEHIEAMADGRPPANWACGGIGHAQ